MGNNIGKKIKKLCKSNCFSDTLKNQGVLVWLIVGCFFGGRGEECFCLLVWFAGVLFSFSPILVFPFVTKSYELSRLLFPFPAAVVVPLPSKCFIPSPSLLLCTLLSDSFFLSIASGPAQGSPRAQRDRGYDFSFSASSSARSSNCSKMDPTLMM